MKKTHSYWQKSSTSKLILEHLSCDSLHSSLNSMLQRSTGQESARSLGDVLQFHLHPRGRRVTAPADIWPWTTCRDSWGQALMARATTFSTLLLLSAESFSPSHLQERGVTGNCSYLALQCPLQHQLLCHRGTEHPNCFSSYRVIMTLCTLSVLSMTLHLRHLIQEKHLCMEQQIKTTTILFLG